MAESDKPAVANPAAVPPERQTASIRYIDRPELEEHFADAVTGLLYDGQTLRMEFGVTRFDELKPNTPITGRRYPSLPVRDLDQSPENGRRGGKAGPAR